MYKFLFLLGLLCPVKCEETRAPKFIDPYAVLNTDISHVLAYLLPWSQLVRAAVALDAEESFQEPEILSDPDRFEVNINVKRFKPDDLIIKVKNGHIIVEGKQFIGTHFVQRFALPAGSKSEEVTAVLKENGVLTITAPRHEVPPPPPEREVSLIVKKPEENIDKEEADNKKKNQVVPEEPTTMETSIQTSSASPIEQLDLVEATTYVGKIRKKELKTTTKTSNDNEVKKDGDGNGLNDALIEAQE